MFCCFLLNYHITQLPSDFYFSGSWHIFQHSYSWITKTIIIALWIICWAIQGVFLVQLFYVSICLHIYRHLNSIPQSNIDTSLKSRSRLCPCDNVLDPRKPDQLPDQCNQSGTISSYWLSGWQWSSTWTNSPLFINSLTLCRASCALESRVAPMNLNIIVCLRKGNVLVLPSIPCHFVCIDLHGHHLQGRLG